mgnify:CR=1 FL=1
MCLSLGSIGATVDSELVEYRRNHWSGIRRISSIPSTGGCAHVSFKFDQLKLSGIRECREVGDSENRACEISLARLSPRLLLLCGGNSSDIYLWWILWDEQIQNKKELIRLASAGMGGLFFFVWRALSWRLDLFADFRPNSPILRLYNE